jgi:RNAse (barnase) inhibitor barstar
MPSPKHAEHLARRLGSLAPGVYRWSGRDSAEQLAAALASLGGDVAVIDVGTTAPSVFESFARALAFPDGSGRNWDALYDLLSDYAAGRTLIVEASALTAADPQAWAILRTILQDTATWFNVTVPEANRQPFLALVYADGDEVVTAVSLH